MDDKIKIIMTFVRKLFHCKDTRTVNICHFLNSCFNDYIIRDFRVMYNVCIFLSVETRNTPNANMENDSVGALEEFNESEANWALAFCFDNASPAEKSWFVDNLCFVMPTSFHQNATRMDGNCPTFASKDK